MRTSEPLLEHIVQRVGQRTAIRGVWLPTVQHSRVCISTPEDEKSVRSENRRMNKQLQRGLSCPTAQTSLEIGKSMQATTQEISDTGPSILCRARNLAEKKASVESHLPWAFLGNAASQTRWFRCAGRHSFEALILAGNRFSRVSKRLARQALVQYLLQRPIRYAWP